MPALLACLALAGCRLMGATAYYLGPPHVQKAEYRLAPGRLAVLIEPVRAQDENPLFVQALHDALVREFREHASPTPIVPFSEVLTLRRDRPDSRHWSLQRVGRELDAVQVLYVQIDRLELGDWRTQPVVEPAVELRCRVIDTHAAPSAARAWPPEGESDGRRFVCTRPAEEVADAAAWDTLTMRLARDAARAIVEPFFDIDLEQRRAREP